MIGDVLDYSAGWPRPAAVLGAGFVGVVRYIGTPGRPKNLTPTEAAAMLDAGIPIGLVYEESAGWMTRGRAAGVSAAAAAVADAAACRVGVRCVHFACDVDITNATQMAAVMACLDGAASVLGRDRVGVYGEADVIDAAIPGHATWGWQTRAWSGGRVSDRAHLLQQIGYVSVGGVQCDRSTVLQPDAGLWPAVEADDMSDTQYQTIIAKLDDMYRLIVFGDAADKVGDPGGHPNNLERVRVELQAMRTTVLAQQAVANAAISALSTTFARYVSEGGADGMDASDVRDALREALRDALVHVDVTVQGQQQPTVPDAPTPR